jgi:hypothetical protein
MNTGTEPHDLPIGVTLSDRLKEILLAARALQDVLGRHNMTFVDFAALFHGKCQEWNVDLAICDWQLHEDKNGALQSTLEKLSAEEKHMLSEHFKTAS